MKRLRSIFEQEMVTQPTVKQLHPNIDFNNPDHLRIFSKMYYSDKPYSQIAKRFKVSTWQIQRHVKIYGHLLKPPRKTFDWMNRSPHKETIVSMYHKGYTQDAIATKLGASVNTFRDAIKHYREEWGLPSRFRKGRTPHIRTLDSTDVERYKELAKKYDRKTIAKLMGGVTNNALAKFITKHNLGGELYHNRMKPEHLEYVAQRRKEKVTKQWLRPGKIKATYTGPTPYSTIANEIAQKFGVRITHGGLRRAYRKHLKRSKNKSTILEQRATPPKLDISNPEHVKTFKNMLDARKSHQEIANHFGYNGSAQISNIVLRHGKKLGIKPRGKGNTSDIKIDFKDKDVRKKFVSLYKSGMTHEDMAKEFGVNQNTIKHHVDSKHKKLGIVPRGRQAGENHWNYRHGERIQQEPKERPKPSWHWITQDPHKEEFIKHYENGMSHDKLSQKFKTSISTIQDLISTKSQEWGLSPRGKGWRPLSKLLAKYGK